MKKNKNTAAPEEKEEQDLQQETVEEESTPSEEKEKEEIQRLNEQLEAAEKKTEELTDRFTRLAAEYDNFKKRSAKEKDAIYLDASANAIEAVLPVLDNLERAMAAAAEMDDNPLKQGVDMVLRQFKECFQKLGVEEIQAAGAVFDPNFHHAVASAADEDKESGTILEVLQKGYKLKDKVIRYSMVKVCE